MRFNTKDLINNLSGKNKAFITRVTKHQEERYGNVDVFSASVQTCLKRTYFEYTKVEMDFGENWIEFSFKPNGELCNTYGNGQGHKYHKSLESCATELFQKFGGNQ